MGLTNVTKLLAVPSTAPARLMKRPTMPPPPDVVVLKHCRCVDCQNFTQVGEDYFCSEYIGGTSVVWATGRRQCEPPPDAWHYCSHYHGPQVSKDVWAWRRRSHHVGAGSNIASNVEQPGAARPCATPSRNVKGGKLGNPIGTPPASVSEDRDGNGQEHRFCLLRT